MSSILKALRRLEEERARKSSVAPEIAANLLRSGARQRSNPSQVWAIVVTAGIIGAFLLIILWLWRPRPDADPIVTVVSAPPPAVSTSPGRRSEVIIEEVIDRRRLPLIAPAPLSVPSPSPQSIDVAKTKLPAVAMKPTPAPIEERQSPVVSAIAWQEDSSARMAVVDGLPVMTGESIGAIKVKEILREHILFEDAGGLFTVPIQSQ